MTAGEDDLDCGDNSCVFAARKGGMRTNGGCRCLSDLPSAFRRQLTRHILTQRDRLKEITTERDEAQAHLGEVEQALRAIACGGSSDRMLRIAEEQLLGFQEPPSTPSVSTPKVDETGLPVCKKCNDTHRFPVSGDMCTGCPSPCEECRSRFRGIPGPYCASTPCPCACHSDSHHYREVHRRAREAHAAASAQRSSEATPRGQVSSAGIGYHDGRRWRWGEAPPAGPARDALRAEIDGFLLPDDDKDRLRALLNRSLQQTRDAARDEAANPHIFAAPDSLECSHCGGPAIGSPDGTFRDGDGERCMTCGHPGHVSCDSETPAEWIIGELATDYCAIHDCDECNERRRDLIVDRTESGSCSNEATSSDAIEAGQWRTGRQLGRTLYFNDRCVGIVDTPELAELLVRRAHPKGTVFHVGPERFFVRWDDTEAAKRAFEHVRAEATELAQRTDKASPAVLPESSIAALAIEHFPHSSGAWRAAIDHAAASELESILEEDDPCEVYAHGADWGARWMAAIIGMGAAIGRRAHRVDYPTPEALQEHCNLELGFCPTHAEAEAIISFVRGGADGKK